MPSDIPSFPVLICCPRGSTDGGICLCSGLGKFGYVMVWENLVMFLSGKIWLCSGLGKFGYVLVWENLAY